MSSIIDYLASTSDKMREDYADGDTTDRALIIAKAAALLAAILVVGWVLLSLAVKAFMYALPILAVLALARWYIGRKSTK